MTLAELWMREVEKGWRRWRGEVVVEIGQQWTSGAPLEMVEESEGVSMLELGTAQAH